jgi:membrane fusion protein (multidrug efflux system)
MSMRNSVCTVLLASLVTLTGLLLGGCGQKNGEQLGRGSGSGSNLAVEAQVVTPQLLRNRISTTGTLMANEEVELRSEVSGRVTGVFFDEGKRVKRGELLLKINDRELRAQLKGKEAEEKQAADQERRQRRLLEANVISQEDYDNDLNALHVAQAGKEAVESQLAKTEIAAPFDGIIGLRYVSEGGYVTPSVRIATMQNVDPMKIEFSVPEKHARQIRNGTKITVRVGESQTEYAGAVYAVESKIDSDTRTIKARARIPNPREDLIAGSFGKVEITLEELPDAIVIPSGAVIPRISDEIVYVCRNGQARLLSVTTGIRTESGVQVTQGLNPGDTLLITGLLQLTDGKDVRITALRGQ